MSDLSDKVEALAVLVNDLRERLPGYDYPQRAMLEDMRLEQSITRMSRETVTVPINLFDDVGAAAASTSTAAAALAAHVADANPHTVYLLSATAATTYGKIVQVVVTGVNINSTNTDVATFTGLPASYRVLSIRVGAASVDLSASAASVAVRTAASGGGDLVVNESTMTGLTASDITTPLTVNTGDNLRTASTLYLRNYVAHGSAATISAVLTIERWA